MVIFLRGYAGPDRWRTICHYKYIELVELEKGSQIRQKYNQEILIVLPYPSNTVKLWLEVLPEQLVKIKNRKYQENLKQLDEKGNRQSKGTAGSSRLPAGFYAQQGQCSPSLSHPDRCRPPGVIWFRSIHHLLGRKRGAPKHPGSMPYRRTEDPAV